MKMSIGVRIISLLVIIMLVSCENVESPSLTLENQIFEPSETFTPTPTNTQNPTITPTPIILEGEVFTFWCHSSEDEGWSLCSFEFGSKEINRLTNPVYLDENDSIDLIIDDFFGYDYQISPNREHVAVEIFDPGKLYLKFINLSTKDVFDIETWPFDDLGNWSPSGEQFVFTYHGINILDLKGGKVTKINNLPSEECIWSPYEDGLFCIAYLETPSDIYFVPMNGGEYRITSLGLSGMHMVKLQYSKARNALSFIENGHSQSTGSLYMGEISKLDGKFQVNPIKIFESRMRVNYYSWSPDGNKIVLYGHSIDDYSQKIIIVDVNTKKILREIIQYGHYPAWSKDGSFLVFLSSRSDELIVLDAKNDFQQLNPAYPIPGNRIYNLKRFP